MEVENIITKNQSRENILQAATRLFHLRGYHATGLNQILKESGAPKGSLYYHFPNGKEQLAAEAIQLSGQIIAANIQTNLSVFDEPIEAFQYNIQLIAKEFEHIDQLAELPTVPLGLLAAETALVNDTLRSLCEETFELWETLYIEKLLAGGYSEERAHLIGTTMNALIEGGVTLSLTRKSSDPLLQIQQLIPLLLADK